MYGYKYQKYLYKYLKLNRVNPNNDNSQDKTLEQLNERQIDWYLFFDTHQVATDIINLTSDNNILILVGNTPSYLAPLLEDKRKIYHLAFTGKPFGCFVPPYATLLTLNNNSSQKDTKSIYHSLHSVFTPTRKQLHNYFNYLNTKTELTKEFIRDNWHNLVLIDSSVGQSIHGVSIFFNRYAGFIRDTDEEINCANIVGSKPLKFIRLATNLSPTTNLNPIVVKSMFPVRENNHLVVYNYRPDLILYLGMTLFYHEYDFMISEDYPRLVPEYYIHNWDKPLVPDPGHSRAFDNLLKLRSMKMIYEQLKINKKMSRKQFNKILETIQDIQPKFRGHSSKDLLKFLDKINLLVLKRRWIQYFV